MLLCNSICSSSLLNRFKYLRNKNAIWVTGLYIWLILLHLKQTPAFTYPWNFCILLSSSCPQTSDCPWITCVQNFSNQITACYSISPEFQILIFNHLLELSIWMSHGSLTPQKCLCLPLPPPPPNLFHLFGSLRQEIVQPSPHPPKWTTFMSSLIPLSPFYAIHKFSLMI